MYVYWAMFAFPAFSALFTDTGSQIDLRRPRLGLALLLAAFVILIGARYEVGGDWFTYEGIVDAVRSERLVTSLGFGDPGFQLVSWISTRIGLGSAGPSSFCGLVLIYGLWRFVKRLPDPWLATTASVPYLIIVVGMGYVRQGAAIGFILLAFTQFEQGRLWRFLKWMGFAALFHVSSVCILPVAALVLVRKKPLAFIPVVIVGAALYVVLLQSRMDKFYENYVVAEYDSSGALVRLAMNAVPALLFIVGRKRFHVTENARALWLLISLMSLALVVLVMLSPATTALDRIGLYCIPIQLFVFGHLASIVSKTVQGRRLLSAAAITYYAVVLFIWLNYATNAQSWVPYHLQPLG